VLGNTKCYPEILFRDVTMNLIQDFRVSGLSFLKGVPNKCGMVFGVSVFEQKMVELEKKEH
jgi:hypothetical protein